MISGEIFSLIALSFGFIFLLFALKYYISSFLVLFGSRSNRKYGREDTLKDLNHREMFPSYFLGKQTNPSFGDESPNEKYEPFVSIHLPLYNEKNVARRIIEACMNIQYTNFEVVAIDDSRDETVNILKELAGKVRKPTLKIVHRKDRTGFKGGALNEALKNMDPRAEYIVVFDADFIPSPDILNKFAKYFQSLIMMNSQMMNLKEKGVRDETSNDEPHPNISACVIQGYQLHSLNKSENWITKAVRTEFSGSYMIERVAEEFYGALKMISGSVFMVRADVMRNLGWSTSLTEDWELTLRLYQAGFKVIYTPLIQAPAEIPKTLQRLIRQRMRWAEGHTFCVKRHFKKILGSSKISALEKLEFLYFAPYYLQSLLLLIGTISWALAIGLNTSLPFWTASLGWILVIVNLLALPMMNLSGLYLERSVSEDFKGLLGFIVLNYLLAPFQAYAALKGLVEEKEGVWFRTPKTGKITNNVLYIHLRRVVRWAFPRERVFRKRLYLSFGRIKSILEFLFILLLTTLFILLTYLKKLFLRSPLLESERFRINLQ